MTRGGLIKTVDAENDNICLQQLVSAQDRCWEGGDTRKDKLELLHFKMNVAPYLVKVQKPVAAKDTRPYMTPGFFQTTGSGHQAPTCSLTWWTSCLWWKEIGHQMQGATMQRQNTCLLWQVQHSSVLYATQKLLQGTSLEIKMKNMNFLSASILVRRGIALNEQLSVLNTDVFMFFSLSFFCLFCFMSHNLLNLRSLH